MTNIPSASDISAYRNKISHFKNNSDHIFLRSAERWVNELVIDEIQRKMRENKFSQKIWMGTKIISSRIENNQAIITIQNYYFSESGFDVAVAREYGTKDHWVRPTVKLALSWIQQGRRLFSKGHIVSGIKSLHIIRDVIKEQMPEVKRRIDQDFEEWRDSTFE